MHWVIQMGVFVTLEQKTGSLVEVLQDLERKYRALVEASNSGYVALDGSGRVLEANGQFLRLIGRKHLQEIRGAGIAEWIAPHDQFRGMEGLRNGIARGFIRDLNLDCMTPEGGITLIQINATVHDSLEGPRMLAFCRAIPERQILDDSLRHSVVVLRSLFHRTTEGVAIFEATRDQRGVAMDHRLVDINPACETYTGIGRSRCIGLLASELRKAGSLLCPEIFSLVAEDHQSRTLETYLEPTDKHICVSVFSPDHGSIVTVLEDVTGKRSVEECRRLGMEIQQAQKMESLGLLVGGVSHDMNNVLQAIHGMATVLRMRFPEEPTLASGLDIILNSCDRGRDLVRNITDFARKGLTEFQPLDLNQLARQEVALLRHTTRHRIELRMELTDPLPAIFGDSSSIGNVLMNLCVNAIDAMPGKGELCFRTRLSPDGFVELVVEDTGHGMPPEILARAREPFFTTKPMGKGTGLGLSGAEGAMKAHGGSLEIQSEVGRGTRVSLRFPPFTADPAPESSPFADSGSERAEPLRTLLAEFSTG